MTRMLHEKHRLTVTNEAARTILRQIDPVGVESRRRHRLVRQTYWSKGPNHTWHVDGYDKLCQYGFLISGSVATEMITTLLKLAQVKMMW